MDMEYSKVLTLIGKGLSRDQITRICFLALTVLPLGTVEKIDNLPSLYRTMKDLDGIGKNTAICILKRFLEIIGSVKSSSLLDPLLNNEQNITLPSLDKLYFYEILIMVCDSLGTSSFKDLLHRVPECLLGCNRDQITTPIELFIKLMFMQALCVEQEMVSLDRLCEWLEDISRLDIRSEVMNYKRPVLEQGCLHDHNCYVYCGLPGYMYMYVEWRGFETMHLP